MKFLLSLLLLACALLSPDLLLNVASAQQPRIKDYNNNGWYMYFGDHKLSDRWGVHTEVQLRRHNIIADPQQLLIRTGVNYNLTPGAMLTLGYGFIETHPYGDYPAAGTFPEQRIYQQLQLQGSLARLGLSHRYRLEQRWVRQPEASAYTYLNRARYMLKATLPFSGNTLEPGELFLAAYDEVFVGFGKNVRKNIFDQNRAYVALGYKISSGAAVELGYLKQIVQKADGVVFEHNQTLQVSLFHNLNFARSN
ncbi:DUF2490 domain-containing protein [Pontibacter akesuensis]|uniref:DUF2490 domain-containing protein n=1 Tax=Pontibacter akesuensis TaxID=388950 RepID=A0A1I7KL49_9BACT|nr:DUF2490 domain-containing protein [Pontibacter akesuensis]GHA78053.1 hypothetical protein GCM10007389_34920 [Pontibacter akesuensis]SFU98121.1 Protein of unknown function [Pontibacter akesuensis]